MEAHTSASVLVALGVELWSVIGFGLERESERGA